MWSLILDLLFPPHCVQCGRFGAYACETCLADFSTYQQPIPLELEQPALDQLWAVTTYDGLGKKLIKKVKFGGVYDICQMLAEITSQVVEPPQVDLIIPVPLHKNRERDRGFNQAKKYAQQLGKIWHLPVKSVLIRQRPTLPQADLDREHRLTNLYTAFTLTPESSAAALQGQRILLVDDVTTTGSTLNECAKVLKQNGANEVWGLVIANG